MNIYAVNSIKKNNNSVPSFSGHVLTKDEKGDLVYKLNYPNAPAGSRVEVALLTKNRKGDYAMAEKPKLMDLPEGFNGLTLKAKDFNLNDKTALGYKFHINGKVENDKGLVDSNGFNIALPINAANHTLPRHSEHLLIDSFNVVDPGKFIRNHFNLLGGTINSVNDKVEDLYKFGVRNFLGTPLFGQDNKSSHGYWTTNAYQITNNFGDKADFDNLMVNLYNHNMNWTADGAFVNEGVEGIHVKDIMRFGKESPFLAMFESKDIGDEPIKFGILSKQADVRKHTHIKLVNAPYTIHFEKTKDGYKEGKIEKTSYDPTKPTYIQLFDDRLASEEQVNGKSTFNVYANKNTDDFKEISNYKDAVQAYNFRVEPKDVQANYEKYKEIKNTNEKPEFKNTLTEWSNFKIVPSNKDGGISLWVGNSDISKKRFVLPESSISEMNISPEEKATILAAQYQVQDDTVQVAKFWTGEVSRTLISYSAKQIADKVNEGKSYEDSIKELVSEKKLPSNALSILEKQDGKNSPLENILKTDDFGDREYNLNNVKIPASITDGMMSYSFDAIEFSPDLSSVFAYPHIKNLAVTADTVGMSRYEMHKMGNAYYNKMPEQYRKVYKKMDDVIASSMKNQSLSIMKELENKSGLKLFDDKNLLTQEGKEIYGLVAPDIAKFLIVSAIAPDVKYKDGSNKLEYDVKELQKVDLNSLNLQYSTTPADVADKLVDKIKYGIDNLSESKRSHFINHLSQRISNVNSDSYNVARLIAEKTEAGLNWRIDASKDVGDWDAVDAGKFSSEENCDRIIDFWKAFNSAVREHNPQSYTIGELTDGKFPHAEFTRRTGFSTISDYDFFYSTVPQIYGPDEKGVHKDDINEAVGHQLDQYFKSGLSNSINFIHRFVGNQDKPRILHLLAMDVGMFNKDKNKAMSQTLLGGFERTPEFNELPDSGKKAIKEAIKKLSTGKYTHKGQNRVFDNENFGVRPFEVNIKDVIKEAKESDEGFRNYANDSSNSKRMKYLEINAFSEIVTPAMKKYRAMKFMMAALPGSPTNYAGDELGMTGWETETKNEKQLDRNALPWNWLEDTDYSFIKDQYSDLTAVENIRNKPEASALVNGTLIPLAAQPLNEGGDAVAFYRYNDKTDAICLFHNQGYSADPKSAGLNRHARSINLGWMKNGLKPGTIYHDVLNSDNKYKVTSQYEVKREGGGDIDLGNAGLILVRDRDFNGKEFVDYDVPVSEGSNTSNANINLHNKKFDFSYMSR